MCDSWKALSCLRDCMATSVRNYLVYKVAHVLAGISDLGSTVELMWVPGHLEIVGIEVADWASL